MIPFRKAIAILFFSIFVVSGSATVIYYYLSQLANARANDQNFRIVAIAQKTSAGETVPTAYFAEILGLSVDRFQSLYRFDVDAAKITLEESPLIRKVEIKKIKPGTLYIDYALRQPIAYSGDMSNTAIAADGVAIPFNPFFRPKKMAQIITGGSVTWGEALSTPEGNLALEAFQFIKENLNTMQVLSIDTSHAYDSSYGLRQIIVVLEKPSVKQQYILRLSTEGYREGWHKFRRLPDPVLKGSAKIIDLRIADLAFISE